MKTSLAAIIYLKCALIFRGRNDGIHKNITSFGFDCGDGWFQIIEALSLEIEKIALRQREAGIEEDFLPRVKRIKQKFGTLRFYVHNNTQEIQELIEEAQAQSAITCEQCGNPGKIGGEDYIRVLCDACRAEKSAQ